MIDQVPEVWQAEIRDIEDVNLIIREHSLVESKEKWRVGRFGSFLESIKIFLAPELIETGHAEICGIGRAGSAPSIDPKERESARECA